MRQLRIPLISFDVYDKLMDDMNLGKQSKNNLNILEKLIQNLNLTKKIKQCIVDLPPAHYLTLKYLMKHLFHLVKRYISYDC